MASSTLVIEAKEVILPKGEHKEGPVYVTIEGGKITDIATAPPPSSSHKEVLKTHLLIPGFIDLHIHGLGE